MARKRTSGRGSAAVTGLALGIAGGTALGAYVLAPEGGITLGNSSEVAKERDDAVQARNLADIRADAANNVIEPLTKEIVADALTEIPVTILVAPDAPAEAVDGVTQSLKAAGAPDGGRIDLTQKFLSPQGADGLKDVVTSALPANVTLDVDRRDPGRQAGQAMASVLLLGDDGAEQATATDRRLLLESLRDGGYIDYKDGTLRPSAAVVILTGAGQGDGKDPAFGAGVIADFAGALGEKGHVVVAGTPESAVKGGVVAAMQARNAMSDSVHAIAAVEDPAGRVGVVRALVNVKPKSDGE